MLQHRTRDLEDSLQDSYHEHQQERQTALWQATGIASAVCWSMRIISVNSDTTLRLVHCLVPSMPLFHSCSSFFNNHSTCGSEVILSTQCLSMHERLFVLVLFERAPRNFFLTGL